MAQHYTVTTLLDKTVEKSQFKLFNGPITAGTIVAFLSEYAALKAALNGICFNNVSNDLWVGDATQITATPPASNYAQRENKLLLRYEGQTSHKLFTATVPSVDLAKLTFVPGGKDAVSIVAGAEMIALVAAVNQLGRTPDSDAETIVVQSAQFVGRNI